MINKTLRDDYGNKYVIINGKVTLHLQDERVRKIGQVYEKERNNAPFLVYEKLEDENNVYRKLNAWSIPLVLVRVVDGIQFETKYNTYKILAVNALKQGQIMYLDSVGEDKVYVKLEHWLKISKS